MCFSDPTFLEHILVECTILYKVNDNSYQQYILLLEKINNAIKNMKNVILNQKMDTIDDVRVFFKFINNLIIMKFSLPFMIKDVKYSNPGWLYNRDFMTEILLTYYLGFMEFMEIFDNKVNENQKLFDVVLNEMNKKREEQNKEKSLIGLFDLFFTRTFDINPYLSKK